MSVLLLLLTLTLDESSLRVGESVNGFPSWEERVLHQWINRARVEPQIEMAKCGAACAEKACYSATTPLYWNEALNRAARFHSAEMVNQGYFGHDSKCTVVNNINSLYPVACDGSASCACAEGAVKCGTGGCTSFAARIGMFGAGPEGEIIASIPDPNTAFYLWLYEPASPATCGFNNQNGHRYLILKASSGVGAGVVVSSVVDFGTATPNSKIPSAAHYPRQADSVEVWANWFDTAAPKSASVVVDGRCNTMTLK
ncbi:MAG: CAP domain-containing protein, partial [Thermoanaerobaculia bacterium]